MKTKGVVGKRIKSIMQRRVYRDDNIDGEAPQYVGMGVLCIELEDGTRLEPYTLETGNDYAVSMYVRKVEQ